MANAVSDENSIQSSVSPQIIEEKDPNYKGPDNISSFSGNAGMELKEGENLAVSGGDVSLNDAPTLAFPSISTLDKEDKESREKLSKNRNQTGH